MAVITARKYFNCLLLLFVVLSFVGVTGAWQPRAAFASADDTGGGDVVRQVVYVVLALITLAPIFPRTLSRLVAAIPASMWVLFGWCALTLAWSPVPAIGFRRLVVTVLIAFCCLSATRQVAPNTSLMVIWRALVLLMLLSFATIAIAPEVGIHQMDDVEASVVGSWRGVFYHKNILGVAMAFLVLLTLYGVTEGFERMRGRWARRAVLIVLAMALGLLIMSGSKTSLAMTIVAGGLYLVLNASRVKSGRVLAAATLTVAFGVIIVTLLLLAAGIDLQGVLLDPALFTGRGFIWRMLWDIASDNPVGGVGYQSVFQAGDLSALAGITGNTFYDTLSHAHNAYLELFVSIGGIGLATAIVTLLIAPLKVAIQLPSEFDRLRILVVSLLAFIFLHGFLESGILDRDRASWLVLLLTYGVARAAAAERARPRALDGRAYGA